MTRRDLCFRFAAVAGLLLPALTAPGCGGSNASDTDRQTRTFVFDFANDQDGFTAGFTDLPVNYNPDIYNLEFGYDVLPVPGTNAQRGLRIQGNNRSDDLFMFVKRKITGLSPNTSYRLTFDVTFLSDAPESGVGIGGSPGSSVYMKAGALNREPVAATQDGGIELNADKGQQSQSGTELGVIGTIGIAGEEAVYTVKSLASPVGFRTVTTDATGAAWIIVGTDSGYEGLTRLYYSRIRVRFTANR